MSAEHFRFLFCLPTTQLSGGVKVIFALTDMLVERGHRVDLFSYAGAPEWCTLRSDLIDEKNLSDVDMSVYNFVVVSNAVFIPMVLPLLRGARCVFFAQDYESFHHAAQPTFDSFLSESPGFRDLYSLPVPIIATSVAVVRLIRERVGKTAYYSPVGINKQLFSPQARTPSAGRKRVLLVGNYLMPYKGMRDGLDALEELNKEIAVELVLITQEERGRRLFDSYSYTKEIHFCPAEPDVPAIIASCDAYCCTSWYEGLGLPALECFCCGTPVVSTRTLGVDEYADDNENLLLANPNDPADLRDKLQLLLANQALARRLIDGGFKTVRDRYEWSTTVDSFLAAIRDIDSTYAGAGEIDGNGLVAMLHQLEMEGSFTPIETYREFQRLSACLANASRELQDIALTDDAVRELRNIRDSLREYVANERAQYYAAFKAKYDLCLLLIELAGTPDEVHIPRLLESAR